MQNSELIISQYDIEKILDQLANLINICLKDLIKDPIICMTVMNGGMMFAAHLVPKLSFQIEMDYLHVGRYGSNKFGNLLSWMKEPHLDVKNRVVLLLDDIFDEGITLQCVSDYLKEKGAYVYTAVMFHKEESEKKAKIIPDFIGCKVPNKWLFGFGMDLSGKYRNLLELRAII